METVQPPCDEEVAKPEDWLPDGTEKEHYLKPDKEWPGIEKRLGEPRILKHLYLPGVLDWIQNKYKDHPDDFSYFEAGCGHGNDLRAMRERLDKRGHFLGVDMSKAEIMHGLQFYGLNEDTAETRKLFAQGDLRQLKSISVWNEQEGDYSEPMELQDGQFDLVYMEAVLHGLGYGKKTYREKKEAARLMLQECHRICTSGGKFLGRASVFDDTFPTSQRFDLLRETNNWRFYPGANELEEMFAQAGFTNMEITLKASDNPDKAPHREHLLRFSFLAEK